LKIIVRVLVCFLREIITQGLPIDPILPVLVPQAAVPPHPLPPHHHHHLLLAAAVQGEGDMEGVGIEILFSKNRSLKV
jgi:hypothetical protein